MTQPTGLTAEFAMGAPLVGDGLRYRNWWQAGLYAAMVINLVILFTSEEHGGPAPIPALRAAGCAALGAALGGLIGGRIHAALTAGVLGAFMGAGFMTVPAEVRVAVVVLEGVILGIAFRIGPEPTPIPNPAQLAEKSAGYLDE